LSGLRPTEETYAELQLAYDHFNQQLFGGELPGALLTLQREKNTFGYFSRNRFVGRREGEKVDEIALNPSFFAVVPLVEVFQTLVHEMVHQWQHHYGKPGRTRYHNHEWAEKMESIGLMPSSTGRPGGRKVGQKVADYAVDSGPFLDACEALVTDAFRLTWVDRFPSSKQLALAADLPSYGVALAAGGGSAPMHELVAQHIASAATGGPAPIEVPQEQASRARIRYVCECRNRVWGRPGLKLRCDDCKMGYSPS
jgi:predicted SprT family Zn-dependent metalloprotease